MVLGWRATPGMSAGRFALDLGAAVVSMPHAFADTTGSAGSNGSDAAASAQSSAPTANAGAGGGTNGTNGTNGTPVKSSEGPTGIRAYRFCTGAGRKSHMQIGTVDSDDVIEAESIMFDLTPAHSSYDWHNAPVEQYVLTLIGVIVFTMMTGEAFTTGPGNVLLANDLTSTGHEWQMIVDERWRRAYVIFPPGVDTHFVTDPS